MHYFSQSPQRGKGAKFFSIVSNRLSITQRFLVNGGVVGKEELLQNIQPAYQQAMNLELSYYVASIGEGTCVL